jgi:hypothetical protein
VSRIILITALLGLAGCATTQSSRDNVIQGMSGYEYASLIKKHTTRTNQYSGFYQTFQADMTILTTEVQSAALKQRGQFLQWDQRQFQSERDKMVQEAAAYSKFFLRFYSPEHDYDDLNKGKTIWKVYLDYNGSRFEGKVKKLTEKYVELQTIYPYLDRFSTPYEIQFNVPMTTIENGDCKVVLTSSLGTAEFHFPAHK